MEFGSGGREERKERETEGDSEKGGRIGFQKTVKVGEIHLIIRG